MKRLAVAWALTAAFMPAFAAATAKLEGDGFAIELQVMHRELRPDYCWFHPRAASIPGAGNLGRPAIIATIQKHLKADDHYSGLYYLRSDDLGSTWRGPVEIPELAWTKEAGGVDVAVADVTPGWHAPTGKLIAIGTKVRYSKTGAQLLDVPRSHECAYATFDPKSNAWSRWRFLEMPDTASKFFLVAPGCVQWLVETDGSILLPIYFRGPTGSDFAVAVLQCDFDGTTLRYRAHGDELARKGGRGYCEPSLAKLGDRRLLTLRNDARGYVAHGKDGLHFSAPEPWKFDNGSELGSYNTQQHWLIENGRLYLAYTRRGARNDHIPRNRAPLFMAEVDAETLRILRRTEKVVIPERGAMLGNFGAAAIAPGEWWITDAEYIMSDRPHPRGADGSVFFARVRFAAR